MKKLYKEVTKMSTLLNNVYLSLEIVIAIITIIHFTNHRDD